ncbi:hypothetical protein ACU5EH_25595 [Aliivibrio salmonicida]|uniref:hypothetical protein n=1 Tax=Aliivibrio salmonicida TaxID=40269 RepID=UPI00406BF6D0
MNNERPSGKDLLSYTRKHQVKSTSKTAIITELYDDINIALNEGASIDNIVDFLNTKNIVLSNDHLRSILYRIKKKKQKLTDSE